MKTQIAMLAVLFGQAASFGQDGAKKKNDSVHDPVKAVLTTQAAAWNRGDLNGFMEHYWKSDELTFSSGGKTTRGWKTTKANYQRRYPTREKMGKLTFKDLEVTPLGETAALALGSWHVKRQPDAIGGNFSLVLRRIEGRWVIIHDHTSAIVDKK